MSEQTIFEDEEILIESEIKDLKLKKSKVKFLLLVCLIVIVTIPLSVELKIVSTRNGFNSMQEDYSMAFATFLLGMPVIALIFTSILNFIPFKEYSYRKKFWRTWAIVMLVIHFFILFAFLFHGIIYLRLK